MCLHDTSEIRITAVIQRDLLVAQHFSCPLQSPPQKKNSGRLARRTLSVCFSVSLLKIPLAAEIRVGAASYLTPPPLSVSVPASVSFLLMNINTPSRVGPLISGLIKPPPSDLLWLDRLCSLESACSPHVRVRRRRHSTLWSITIGRYLSEGEWAGLWRARAENTDNSARKSQLSLTVSS